MDERSKVTTSSSAIVNLLFGIACVVVIALGGVRLYDRFAGGVNPDSGSSGSGLERVPNLKLDISQGTLKAFGSPKVALIEFSDFQCPFCARYFRDTYPRIQKDFVEAGRAAYVFYHFPLEKIHPQAVNAAESVECAGRQNKFWEMHDSLFRNQLALRDEDLDRYAQELGLEMEDFRQCVAGTMLPKITSQTEVGRRAGVTSTPIFFVGRIESPSVVRIMYRLSGARPYEAFAEALEGASR